jgi:hypothetical protein
VSCLSNLTRNADAPDVFPEAWVAREWRRGLPTEKLAEVIGHVERLKGVRLPMASVPRPRGGRQTPMLRSLSLQ